MRVRVLSAEDVRRGLPVTDAVDAAREAFVAHRRGASRQPVRLQLDVPEAGGTSLFMPAYGADLHRTCLKVVSVYGGNAERGLPAISGVVLVLDGDTGVPRAVLEGGLLTALRTGGASGAATDALAVRHAGALAVIGAGAQAPYQVRAVCAVRRITHVRIHNRTPERAAALADVLGEELPGVEVMIARSAGEAVRGAQIVCTATSASEPVLAADDLPAGVHVNAVGSFQRGMRELPRDLLSRADRVVVDDVDASMEEAGEIIDAVEAGALAREDLVPLGAVLAGEATGRRGDEDVTVFKSVGLAVQDLHAAARTLHTAEQADLGTLLDLQ